MQEISCLFTYRGKSIKTRSVRYWSFWRCRAIVHIIYLDRQNSFSSSLRRTCKRVMRDGHRRNREGDSRHVKYEALSGLPPFSERAITSRHFKDSSTCCCAFAMCMISWTKMHSYETLQHFDGILMSSRLARSSWSVVVDIAGRVNLINRARKRLASVWLTRVRLRHAEWTRKFCLCSTVKRNKYTNKRDFGASKFQHFGGWGPDWNLCYLYIQYLVANKKWTSFGLSGHDRCERDGRVYFTMSLQLIPLLAVMSRYETTNHDDSQVRAIGSGEVNGVSRLSKRRGWGLFHCARITHWKWLWIMH